MDERFEGCYIHGLQFKPLYHTLTIHLLTIDYMLGLYCYIWAAPRLLGDSELYGTTGTDQAPGKL